MEGSILHDTGASEVSIGEFTQTCVAHLQDLDQGPCPWQAIPLLTVGVKGCQQSIRGGWRHKDRHSDKKNSPCSFALTLPQQSFRRKKNNYIYLELDKPEVCVPCTQSFNHTRTAAVAPYCKLFLQIETTINRETHNLQLGQAGYSYFTSNCWHCRKGQVLAGYPGSISVINKTNHSCDNNQRR